jgi:hypothetical protein
MNKKNLIFVTLLFSTICVYTQEITDVWEFPIRPGTQEWENLKTYSDRLNAYNIPENQIKIMNTESLVKTCLNYPEFRLIFTRNDLQSGFNYLKEIFNGYQELITRKDACDELLKVYKKMDPIKINKNWEDLEIGRFIVEFIYIEILLAQNEILSNTDSEAKKELISEAIKKFESKNLYSEEYGVIGLCTPVLIIARILEAEGNITRNETVNEFLDYVVVENPSILYEIVTKSKEYLK